MHRVKLLAASFLTLGLAMAMGAPTAHAAQSITITPTSVDQTIAPGSQITGTIQVLNQAESAFDFKVYATPYSVNGEEYDPSFSPIAGATDITDWMTLKAESNRAQPYSGTRLNYTVKVPKDTKPGGYYGVVFAETQSQVEGSGVMTRQRVGTVMYLRVAGPVEEAGKVASWQVDWFQKPNLTQVLRIENSGSVHFAATVHTAVRDLFGSSKFDYKQKREILPQKVRKITPVWQKTPPIGLFAVSGTAEFLGQTTQLPTKYVLVLSDQVRTLILALIGIFIIFSIIKTLVKRRRKKKARTSAPQDQSSAG